MKKLLPLTLTLALSISAVATAGSASAADKTKVEFFQYKSEAVASFDKLIKEFEAANPSIDIVQTNVPDQGTVLKTRIAKKNIPDIIAVGGDAQYADLVKGDILVDLSKDALLKNVSPGYVNVMKTITIASNGDSKVYGIPYATNANGIIYNKDIFAKNGLKVPTTKKEMDNVFAVLKKNKVTPFYLTFKDAWTTLPAWNVFAAALQPANIYADRKANKTTFAKAHATLTKDYLAFMQNGQSGDRFSNGYGDGNIKFAKGASAMYLQGVWAIPEILKANPNIKLGVFPYPVSNDPKKNVLVSGVDLQFGIAKASKNQAAAKKFIAFLQGNKQASQYISEQNCFSALKGISSTNPIFADLKPAISEGRVADFPDHYINGVDLAAILQELMKKKNVTAALKKFDSEYDKKAVR
jgi:raffinose/stachyose/melibiose transport system substrate-binding protein